MNNSPRSVQHDQPLLPNEPRVENWNKQQTLTERFLLPRIKELEQLFLYLRTELDPHLKTQQPTKLGKAYPLGQCLEISVAIQKALFSLNKPQLPPAELKGYQALELFLSKGGDARQVWGDLRGEYFQNAFLIGTLYIDVANDTVVSTKPPVETLPFSEANFRPIENFHHFSKIAQRYWKAQILPNHLIPELAPFFPIIVITEGGVRLSVECLYMITLTQQRSFSPSLEILEQPSTLPDALFSLLAKTLLASNLMTAKNASDGKNQAIERCKEYKDQHKILTKEQLTRLLLKVSEVNKVLQRIKVTGS